jgi:8-oxo-dGTP pyrophosphatase MutT (NUDIX family)
MRFETHETDILKLINIVQSDRNVKEHPEWLFPKGKPDHFEDSFTAARREFEEETGVVSKNLGILPGGPITSYYQADNDFVYETQYWVALFDDTPEMPSRFQSYEVMTRRWFTRAEIEEFARPHQLMVLRGAAARLNRCPW